METFPGPTLVLVHWPFVRRNLELSQSRAIGRALDLLARVQYDGEGEPAQLPRSRFVGAGFTPGEATAAGDALTELTHRRVVWRWRGSGRRADAWAIRGDVKQWRGMPWTRSARDVGTVVGACSCGGPCAVVAVPPGQSGSGPGKSGEFWLSEADHLRRPGLLPVDVRHYGAASATTAQRPGLSSVDNLGTSREAGGRSLFKEEPKVLPCQEDEQVETLTRAIEAATPGQPRGPNGRAVWGIQLRRLSAVARSLDAEQARWVAERIASVRDSYPVRLVTTCEELAGEARRRRIVEADGPARAAFGI